MTDASIDTVPMFPAPPREVLRPAHALPEQRREEARATAIVMPLPNMPEPVIKAVAAKTAAQAEKDAKPSWTSYSGKRAACDECLIFLHENGGKGPFPRSVRRVRTVRATGEQLRLCKDHAEPREIADGKTKKKPAARRTTRKG